MVLQVTDEMLSVIASISTLNAVDVGFSSRCTCKGVMNLAPLSNLQCLSVTGLSSLDSGSLTAENVAKLVSMPRLAVLEVFPPPQLSRCNQNILMQLLH